MCSELVHNGSCCVRWAWECLLLCASHVGQPIQGDAMLQSQATCCMQVWWRMLAGAKDLRI